MTEDRYERAYKHLLMSMQFAKLAFIIAAPRVDDELAEELNQSAVLCARSMATAAKIAQDPQWEAALQ